MQLTELASQVEALFAVLDAEIASFQSSTSLHCPPGCGKCCFKPDIEATELEFLPFALFLAREGKAEQWYERLTAGSDPVCMILDASSKGVGLCSEYKHRGLICRLFGYSARTNKYGTKELVTCPVIKTGQTEAYQKAEADIRASLPVPVMNQFYLRLSGIDPVMAAEFYPINVAIRKALERVLNRQGYEESEGEPLSG